ncbi:MAG: sarcosine oxidase subunit gamma [Heliomarina sp.]|uniref:sarcosine oxidase subunit gamma n=1 Tax=Heliomarina sp. TaxID=2917556 RepID=UPI004059B3B3
MVELVAKTPCAGLLPVSVGDLRIEESQMLPMSVIMPFSGKEEAVGAALQKAHGLALPPVNRAETDGETSVLWFGRGQFLLRGVVPDAGLSDAAAVTDQSDAWAVVRLSGAKAADVLARLVPVDMRLSAFPEKSTVRTDLMHMMASITRLGPDSFQIMVFRSMAQTLVHDLKGAMEAVGARG